MAGFYMGSKCFKKPSNSEYRFRGGSTKIWCIQLVSVCTQNYAPPPLEEMVLCERVSARECPRAISLPNSFTTKFSMIVWKLL